MSVRPVDVVIPAATADLLCARAAERWGPGAVGPRRGWSADVLVPDGGFTIAWQQPRPGEATITELAWDATRENGEAAVRAAIADLLRWPVARDPDATLPCDLRAG
jgi:hypothetical protein